MSRWYDQLQPLISDALRTACQRIADEFEAGIRRKDEEIERLRASADWMSHLEAEKQSLKDEVLELRRRIQSQNKISRNALPNGRLSIFPEIGDKSPLSASRRPLEKLSPKVNNASRRTPETPLTGKKDLQQKYDNLRKVQVRTRDLLRDARRERNRWMEYAEGLENKRKMLEIRLGSLVPDEGDLSEHDASEIGKGAAADVEAPTDHSGNNLFKSFISEPDKRTQELHDISENVPKEPQLSKRASPSSPEKICEPQAALNAELLEETQDSDKNIDEAELPQLPPQRSLNEILFVSNRPAQGRKRKVDDEMASDRVRQFKAENSSSDPVAMGDVTHFSHESDDLDSQRDQMPTPKKHRAHSENNMSANPHSVSDSRAALQGTRVVNRLSCSLTEQGNSRKKRRLDNRIMELTEDGSSPPGYGKQISHNTTEHSTGRLQSLLNTPAVDKNHVALRPKLQAQQTAQLTIAWRDLPAQARYGLFKADLAATKPMEKRIDTSHLAKARTINQVMTPSSTGNNRTKAQAKSHQLLGKPTPRAAPLRSRPLEQLRIGDFKVNPKYHEGLDYTYNDPVRGRSARAQLVGCVNPNCCGPMFRELARSELTSTEGGAAAVLGRPASVVLMERHLGDEAYKLGSMTCDEKAVVWLEAKTYDLANRLGRCRHRAGRPSSTPPGFWDTDFPSTQQSEEDRAEAKRIVKRTISERRREAMRLDKMGRWLFRDE